MRLFYTLASVVWMMFPLQAKTYDLKLHLEKGKTYHQNLSANMTITQSFGGQEMVVEIDVVGGVTYMVQEVNDGMFDMEVKYTNLSMKMKMPQGEMDFGSGREVTDSASQMMSVMFDNMIGKPFYITLSDRGKIKNLEGLDKILEAMVSGFENVPEARKQQLVEQISKSFGRETFISNMEMATAIFPKEPVKVGDTWTIESTLSNTVDIDVSTTYTLTRATDSEFIIKAIAKMKAGTENKFEERNGVLMKQSLSGTSTADIVLFAESCWTKHSEITQNMEGESIMKQGVDGQEMSIPMKLVSVSIITGE